MVLAQFIVILQENSYRHNDIVGRNTKLVLWRLFITFMPSYFTDPGTGIPSGKIKHLY